MGAGGGADVSAMGADRRRRRRDLVVASGETVTDDAYKAILRQHMVP
jgi:hypothetical protein